MSDNKADNRKQGTAKVSERTFIFSNHYQRGFTPLESPKIDTTKYSRPSAVFRNNSLTGFTLIELLVVIAIIGILASVVLASLNSARTKARDASRAAQLREVQKALEMYYSNTGNYPAHNAATTLSGVSSSLVPSYLSSIPLDPTYGDTTNGYRYIRSADFQAYTLLVNLEGDAPIGWCSLNGNGGRPEWNGDPTDGSGTNYVPCNF